MCSYGTINLFLIFLQKRIAIGRSYQNTEGKKIKKQKIQFNVVLDIDQNSLPDEKDIKSIVDYEKITNKLENLAKSKKYNFLESLAEDSFEEIFEDKRINSVVIKIEKPEAIKNAESVGVEVFKTRKDYEGS